jgi:hypothetical protein
VQLADCEPRCHSLALLGPRGSAMKCFFFVFALMRAPVFLSAESARPPAQHPTFAPAKQSFKDIVVFAFGRHGQTWDQPLKRKLDCQVPRKNSPELIRKLPLPPTKRRAKRAHASVHCQTPASAASCGVLVTVPTAIAFRLRIGRGERLSKGLALPNGA